eukprot:g3876.t1
MLITTVLFSMAIETHCRDPFGFDGGLGFVSSGANLATTSVGPGSYAGSEGGGFERLMGTMGSASALCELCLRVQGQFIRHREGNPCQGLTGQTRYDCLSIVALSLQSSSLVLRLKNDGCLQRTSNGGAVSLTPCPLQHICSTLTMTQANEPLCPRDPNILFNTNIFTASYIQ